MSVLFRTVLVIQCCLHLPFVLSGQPGTISQHLKVDQFGYAPFVQKTCVVSNPVDGFNSADTYAPGPTLHVHSALNDSSVYNGPAVSWNGGGTYGQSGDQLWWFDFTAVSAPGSYYVYDPVNDTRSYTFEIHEDIYQDLLRQAVRVFFYQRSGFAKDSVFAGGWWDGASHLGPLQDLDCRLATNPIPATSKSLEGGWFDAGDFNKYVNFAYEPIHDLLFAYLQQPAIWGDDYNIPESGNGIPDLLDEVKWELDWLKRMQQSDGSVLMKVSVTQWQSASPASADTAQRRYGPAQASATRTAASCFALGAIAYELAGMPLYADSLEACAVAAWDWLQLNPGYSSYDNAGFFSANPEMSTYRQFSVEVGAAVVLFARTGMPVYRTFVDAHYADIQPMLWTSWYPFESTIQDLLLYYASLPGATASVADAIENSFLTSMQNSGQLETAIDDSLGGYRAYLYPNENVWGSHRARCHLGSMFCNVAKYGLDPDTGYYYHAGLGFLNFIHGVNPLNLVMLTNMGAFGAEQSANEMYHAWFGHGTVYDNAQTSTVGPAPGYLTGGFNQYYTPDPAYGGTIEPPQNQPPLKSYLDWNTGWPENSWEITEPSISYQAAYVRLLSHYVSPSPCQLNVTSSGDAGAGTLRQAIACAGSGDTVAIHVDSVLITGPTILIDRTLTILGQGNPVLQGQNGTTLFEIAPSVHVHFESMSIQHNHIAFESWGQTTLKDIVLAVVNGAMVPAIVNHGLLTVDGLIEVQE